MTPDLLISLFAASLKLRLPDARILPNIAESLLARGLDCPAIVHLCVLGTEPFDPRDARDAADRAVSELEVPPISASDAARLTGAMIARACRDRRIDARKATKQVDHIVRTQGYRASQPLLAMYAAEDAWDAGWAGTNDQIEAQVRGACTELLEAVPEVTAAVIDTDEWPIVAELLGIR